MKLRTIILILSLLAFLTAAAGGVLYYTAARQNILEEIERQGGWHTRLAVQTLESEFMANLAGVQYLAGKPFETAGQITGYLSHYNAAHGAWASFAADRNGQLLAGAGPVEAVLTSHTLFSLFPHLNNGIPKTPGLALAYDPVFKKRLVYYHSPVSHGDQEPDGVIVTLFLAREIESKFLSRHFNMSGMMAMVVDPLGIIFMADTPGLRMHGLEKQTDSVPEAGLNLPWSGLSFAGQDRALDESGAEYLSVKEQIPSLPGWALVHLHDVREINRMAQKTILPRIGWAILGATCLIGLAAMGLFQMGQKEIRRRKGTEQALKESEQFSNALLQAIPIPVFYKDRQGRYLGFNPAFETFFGKKQEELVGKSVFDISPKALAEVYHAKDEELFESGGVQHYDFQVKNGMGETREVVFDKSVYHDTHGQVIGLIGTVIDVTQAQLAQAERQQLIEELQQALAEIKTLEGIVPICASCKKIRDDQGYWNQIESYIQAHSEAMFSHSMCPECSEKLYGDQEWYIKRKKKSET